MSEREPEDRRGEERQRWTRLQELFLAARDLEGDERTAFLDAEVGDDTDLRARVDRLLAADASDDPFLEPPTDEPVLSPEEEFGVDLDGRTLGGFRLIEEIGRGAMGVVYRAEQADLDRDAAVKVLPSFRSRTPELRERFRREARAAAHVDHPGVVRVLSSGTEGGIAWYAMEFVDGPTLRQALDHVESGGAVGRASSVDLGTPRACAEVARRLAEALEACHAHGIVHRDVKPQNVLLEPDGAPKLADFGIAKEEGLESLTRTGHLTGTPQYMSPEQARLAGIAVDHRSDVYSLGVVLYELLTHALPFRGNTSAELLGNILHAVPADVRRRNPEVPLDLATITTKAMRRRPADRYQSARAFADDLGRFLDGRSVLARPPSLVGRLRDRVTDRRTLLRAAPVGLLAAVGAGFAARGCAEARARRSRRPVVALVADRPLDAAVRFLPLAPEPGRWAEPVDLGAMRGARATFRTPPGTGRLVVRTAEGYVGEYYRHLPELARVEVRATPPTSPPDEERMVRVPGGRARATYMGTAPQPPAEGPPSVVPPGSTTVEVDLAPFWIDRWCVTNGEYRRYVEEARDGRPPDSWTDELVDLWSEPPRADWDELPVVNLSWFEARAYAEWAGKRLPTAAEWRWAMSGAGSPWITPDLVDRLAERFVVLRPLEGLDPTSLEGYLRHAEPARAPDRVGPPGLHHPIGNVLEWVEDPATWPEPGAEDDAPLRGYAGSGWFDPSRERLRLDPIGFPFPALANGALPVAGIRCVRSA